MAHWTDTVDHVYYVNNKKLKRNNFALDKHM